MIRAIAHIDLDSTEGDFAEVEREFFMSINPSVGMDIQFDKIYSSRGDEFASSILRVGIITVKNLHYRVGSHTVIVQASESYKSSELFALAIGKWEHHYGFDVIHRFFLRSEE